jgi:hypothetical protein
MMFYQIKNHKRSPMMRELKRKIRVAALRTRRDPILRCMAVILAVHVGFVLAVSTLAILNS